MKKIILGVHCTPLEKEKEKERPAFFTGYDAFIAKKLGILSTYATTGTVIHAKIVDLPQLEGYHKGVTVHYYIVTNKEQKRVFEQVDHANLKDPQLRSYLRPVPIEKQLSQCRRLRNYHGASFTYEIVGDDITKEDVASFLDAPDHLPTSDEPDGVLSSSWYCA